MVKLPEVMGLVLCERMHVDVALRRISLEGLAWSLRSAVFPTLPIRMSAYVALFDGRGEGEMCLTCTRLETEADIYYHRLRRSFPIPGRTNVLTLPIHNLMLPAPGRYSFALSFDRQNLTTYFLDVNRG